MSPELLGRALGEAPDPELARVSLSRLGERPAARDLLSRPEVLQGAAGLLGFSRAASDFFLAHPRELDELTDTTRRTPGALVDEATADADRLGPEAGLRRFRRRASFRIAARDLAGATVDDVVAELSSMAEACLQVASASTEGPGRPAVIAMGKLGGRELNYASDVDVLFVHSEAGADAQDRAIHAAAALVGLLSRATEEGVALRVDAALRPEGRAGPLSRSLPSAIEYYERHAATWERQALIKARPVAGDLASGEAFVEAISHFVYPAAPSPTAVGDIRASKVRLEDRVRAAGKERSEVKRGRGGIRDVEFAVQLLQLVHGRRYPRLREPGTLAALAALAEEGFVARADADLLAESYRFLRRLEHRLQMVRDLQTHELPPDRHTLGVLARSLGLPDAAHLRAEHIRHTDVVRGVHERLFYRPLLEALAGSELPRHGADRIATEELLVAMGFAEPSAAYLSLERLLDPGTRLGKVLDGLFPVVAPAFSLPVRPELALARLERVVDAAQADPSQAETLADALRDRPDAARRLAALAATSSAFADALAAQPRLALAVVHPPGIERPLFQEDAVAAMIRVAGAHAAGDVDVPETGRHLAAVADMVIGEALLAAAPTVPVAVIGLGRLGGEELSFASDLDVVVVYEGEGRGAFAEAERAAERTLEGVRAAGWTPDPDLRPEGRSGPLARSLVSFLDYWERWAEPWEFQSLLRARFVSGDEHLGRRFLSNAADVAYPEALTLDRLNAIRRMRVRTEQERVRPAGARRFHFKLGYGSLADVQWAVELSLMRHGCHRPEVRRTNTLEALEALVAAGVLEASVAASLAEAQLFLMGIKMALELDRRLPQEALPPSPEEQASLARRLGYTEWPRHRLLQDYRRITHRARVAMDRVFYEGASP